MESNPANQYFGMFVSPSNMSFVQRNARVREKAAAYLGCKTAEMALMPSTTVALNTVSDSLVQSGYLSKGDHILTTDQEHAGGYECWTHMAKCTQALTDHHWPCARQNSSEFITLDIVAIPVLPLSAAPQTPVRAG
jgi:selenocysteine lyase/cysteine desulfurase